MKKGTGKYFKTGGGNYIYLSTKIVNDSTFPLEPGKVTVTIKGRKLIIEQ
jgi:hypothetical protein